MKSTAHFDFIMGVECWVFMYVCKV